MSSSVPEGWSIQTLDGKVDLQSGFPFKSSFFCDDPSQIGLIRIRDLDKQRVETFYRGEYDETYVVRKGDILIGMDGDFSIVRWRAGNALLNQRICRLKASAGSGFDTEFLFHSLVDDLEVIHSATGATTVKHLSVKDIRCIEGAYPPLPEQQKIATILSSVDDVIEKTRAQIDKLKDLKTGMMQELLTKGIGPDGGSHTVFKDSPVGRIPVGWDCTELGKVLIGIDSGWSPNCGEGKPGIGEWGVLKVSAVTRGEFLQEESKVLPQQLSPREKIQVHKGDVLLTRANGVASLVGKCVIVNREPQAKLMMSDKILRLKPTQKLSNEFLLYVFNSRSTRKQIELCWGGSSGQKNISQSDIKNFVIPLPSVAEQKAIAKSISQIDYLLYIKNRKLQTLINSKKSLMQDLLTGAVRVDVEQTEPEIA